MSPETRLRRARALLSPQDLAEFEEQLRIRLKMLNANVQGLDDSTRRTSMAGGDLSNLPVHPADIASDAFDMDMSLGLMESQVNEIGHIKEALERIEDRSFGLCESCDRAIAMERLQAIPYAKLCVDCQRKEEGL